MKLSYSWLCELIEDLPDPYEVADVLTMRGFEVEEVFSPGEPIKDLVVAKIEELKPHPNADKLTLCQVTDGSQEYEIVCGANNMKAGDHVALAYIGTELPIGLKLEKRKIRGVYSQGMLCSDKELNLGDDHSGIMILPESYRIGSRLIDEMGMNDTVFDINITPNRPDGLSAIGIARDLAAAYKKKLKMPDCSPLEPEMEEDYTPSVELKDGDLCPRYTALVIKDIKIGHSPEWLKTRLESCGIRSINNVVDATNLVLLELGQPLHAFDLDKLKEHRIVVRRAKAGEVIKTIDEEERKLDEDMLVIADAHVPCAVAGVMGGFDSEVSEQTTSILLESAYFDPASVRKTSKRMGLSSEASYRFERGVDFNGVIPASYRCAHLLRELAGGKIAGKMGVADTPDQTRLEALRGRQMKLRYAYCDRLLGQTIPPQEIAEIFESLQFKIEDTTEEGLLLQIPSFRLDVEREADLVEEVVRCYGYNRFSPTLPKAPIQAPELQEIDRTMSARLRRLLAHAGLDECVTYSFHDVDAMKKFPPEDVSYNHDVTTMQNPLNVNEAVMRTTLMPSLLQCAKRNVARGNENFGLFEMARTFLPDGDEHREDWKLGAVIVGKPNTNWRDHKSEMDFFDLKGIMEQLMTLCALGKYKFTPPPECLHPKRGGWLQAGKTTLGYMGELHPSRGEEYELPGRVLVFEIAMKPLSDAFRNYQVRFKPYSVYPAMTRDLALLIPEGVPARKVENIIRQESGELLEDFTLFDYYRGKQVAKGYVSAGFRMVFRSPERTLKDEEVDQRVENILAKLKSELDVQLRS